MFFVMEFHGEIEGSKLFVAFLAMLDSVIEMNMYYFLNPFEIKSHSDVCLFTMVLLYFYNVKLYDCAFRICIFCYNA